MLCFYSALLKCDINITKGIEIIKGPCKMDSGFMMLSVLSLLNVFFVRNEECFPFGFPVFISLFS